MPVKSKAQQRLMQAVKHSKKFAKKTGIPQKVAQEMVAVKSRPNLPERKQ